MKLTKQIVKVNKVRFKVYLPHCNDLEVTITDLLRTDPLRTSLTIDTAAERLAGWCLRGEPFYAVLEDKRSVINGSHVIRFQELSRTTLDKTVVITRNLLGTRRMYILDDLPLYGESEGTGQ